MVEYMHIWSVGGGKGGTGKSLVANGLAQCLAERGNRVILVDLDYGGPNQHTFCALRKPTATLGRFFDDRVPLAELVQETRVPGLSLVPGNLNSPDTDNITWAQKQKLFRHLRQLQADQVILDLGAGSQYDTLDTFLLADMHLGVIVPDAAAIENFYLFLKNLKFRQLGNVLSAAGLREQGRALWKDRAANGIASSQDLIRHLRGLSPEFARGLDQARNRLHLHLLLNQVRDFSQVELGLAVTSAMHQHFGVQGRFAGYLRYDKELWQRSGQGPAVPFPPLQGLAELLDGILKAGRPPEPLEERSA